MSDSPEILTQLLGRAALGDQAAFQRLYNSTSPKLFAVALRILRRRDWAEDVLQESFENIWRHAGDYAVSRSAPMTWMTSIVRNRAIDWLRRPAIAAELPELDDEFVAGWADEAPGPLQQLTQSRDAARIAGCLGQLEMLQRQSIALAFYQGLSHSELAEHMQVPLGTAKTWVRRGLEKLRGCLGFDQ